MEGFAGGNLNATDLYTLLLLNLLGPTSILPVCKLGTIHSSVLESDGFPSVAGRRQLSAWPLPTTLHVELFVLPGNKLFASGPAMEGRLGPLGKLLSSQAHIGALDDGCECEELN